VAEADLPWIDPIELIDPSMDQARMYKWGPILQLREQVLGQVEKARMSGLIKASREAQVKIQIKETDILEKVLSLGDGLATVLSVSQARVEKGESPIVVMRADGLKCARCWIYKKDIGVRTQWPDICGRCADAVEIWQKENPELAAEAK